MVVLYGRVPGHDCGGRLGIGWSGFGADWITGGGDWMKRISFFAWIGRGMGLGWRHRFVGVWAVWICGMGVVFSAWNGPRCGIGVAT